MTTASTYDLPNTSNILVKTLTNGITILVYENSAVESVVLYGSLLAGSVYEPLGRAGIASMTAASLMRGTKRRDFDALHSDLEDIGADFDYSTEKHRVTFSGRALAEDLPALIQTLAETLREPAFAAGEIEEERNKRITELHYAQQNTRYIASRTFRQALYPQNHPYHYATYGNIHTLPEISVQDLRDFHERQYRPEGMIVVIVGAVQAQQAAEKAAAALEDWHNPAHANSAILPALSTPREIVRVQTAIPGKTQSDIVVGTLGPPRSAPDYLAASLANSILGEFGMMGRIGNVIREQLGLAYYASSRMDGSEGPDPWSISAGVAPENIELTIERARDEIRRLVSEPVSEQELDDNQSYFTGRLPLRLESNYGIAVIIHAMQKHQLGLDYLLTYRDRIYSITTDDVMQAAQRYLDPDRLVITVAG